MHGSIQYNEESRRDESCQIGLFFRAPKANSAAVDWSSGTFELRYCLSGHPFDLVDSSCSVACASWIGGMSAPDHWHSVAINIMRSSKTTRSSASSAVVEGMADVGNPEASKAMPSHGDVAGSATFTFGEEDAVYNIELFVDGVRRAHSDDLMTCDSPNSRVGMGSDQAGITDEDMRGEVASRWLRELGFLEEETSKNNSDSTESAQSATEKVFKIVLGGGHFVLYPKQSSEKIWFCGRIGSFLILNRFVPF